MLPYEIELGVNDYGAQYRTLGHAKEAMACEGFMDGLPFKCGQAPELVLVGLGMFAWVGCIAD